MRLRFAVIVFVFVSCAVVALVSILPPSLELVSSSEDDTQLRFNSVVATLVSSVNAFVLNAQTLPESVGELWGLDGINFANESVALPVFSTSLKSCQPACIAVYYGTPNNLHMLRNNTHWCRQVSDGTFSRECCPVASLQNATCTGPFVNLNRPYFPTQRPWYAPLSRGPGWSSLYVDFTSGGFAATAGAPVLLPNGTLIAVMAADLTFQPLNDQLAAMKLVEAPSAWALYEAGSNNLLDSSVGVRSDSKLATLANLSTTPLGSAVASLSPSELAYDGILTKRSGTALSREYVAVARVGNVTGVNLRILVLFIEDPSGAKKNAVILSIVLTSCAVIFSSIFIASAAIFFFERPLNSISEAIEFAVARAMGLHEDDDSDDDDDDTRTLSTAADQTVRLPDSHIDELQGITDSFSELADELQRIRAFVPKSCLVTTEALLDTLELASVDDQNAQPDVVEDSKLPEGQEHDSDLSSIHSSATQRHPLESPAPHTLETPARSSRRPSVIGNSPAARETPQQLVQVKSIGRLAQQRSGHLYTGKSLHPTVVTYICVQLRGVAEALEHIGDHHIVSEALGLVADCCDTVARRSNGVIDVYCGDRVTIAFNGMKPNATHRRSAIECVVTISKLVRTLSVSNTHEIDVTLNKHSFEWQHISGAKVAPDDASRTCIFPDGISAGVASSRALVGNMGSANLARFSVVGHCVRAAAAEEAKCIALEGATVSCLCDLSYRNDVSHSVAFQRIDTNTIAPSRMLLDGAKKAKNDDNDGEWMYELQRAQQNNEFNDINDAFDALTRGDTAMARNKLSAATQRSDSAATAVGRARLESMLNHSKV